MPGSTTTTSTVRSFTGFAILLTATTLALSGCTPASGSNVQSAAPTVTTNPTTVPGATTAATSGSATTGGPTASPSPTKGVVTQVVIDASRGFRPRPAYVYLPPAAVKHPDRPLPVLELLHGTPGTPANWITNGLMVQTMDNFAAAHGGQAPIVVVPDINGSLWADSECIRTADGKDTESYISGDVVRWVRSHYARTVGTKRWWVAGLSEGGTCSLMLALRHPGTYSALGDFSGSVAPIIDKAPTATSDKQLYNNNPSTKRSYAPLWLMAHGNYRGLPAWFQCGTSDRAGIRDQARIVAAARTAGLTVQVAYAPGSHRWPVWSSALRSMLPWLWARR